MIPAWAAASPIESPQLVGKAKWTTVQAAVLLSLDQSISFGIVGVDVGC